MGDQILSVNEVSFRNIIRENAVLTLMGLPVGEEVKIIAQPQPEGTTRLINDYGVCHHITVCLITSYSVITEKP